MKCDAWGTVDAFPNLRQSRGKKSRHMNYPNNFEPVPTNWMSANILKMRLITIWYFLGSDLRGSNNRFWVQNNTCSKKDSIFVSYFQLNNWFRIIFYLWKKFVRLIVIWPSKCSSDTRQRKYFIPYTPFLFDIILSLGESGCDDSNTQKSLSQAHCSQKYQFKIETVCKCVIQISSLLSSSYAMLIGVCLWVEKSCVNPRIGNNHVRNIFGEKIAFF